MTSSNLLYLIVVSVTALTATGCSRNNTADTLLNRKVAWFEFHGGRSIRAHLTVNEPGDFAEAAQQLAFHAKVKIAIEFIPDDVARPVPVDIALRNATIEEILTRAQRQDGRYSFAEGSGVIEVFPKNAQEDSRSCLNMVIPSLRIHYPWSSAWTQVRCAIDIMSRDPARFVDDPLAQGVCSGASHLRHPPSNQINETFRLSRVRDILDRISAEGGNACWYARFDRSPRSCANMHLGEYQPDTWYFENDTSTRMIQGLPGNCRSCHYHAE